MTLPFDLTAGQGVFLGCAVLIAAFVRGYSGFGFSALVVAATALVSDPLYAVAVVLFCEVLMTLQQARGIAPHIDWRRVGWLTGGALIGLPVGVHGLLALGLDASRIVIALFILAMCGVLLAGFRIAAEVKGWPNGAMGLLSGVANGAAMAGLPVAAFFAAQPMHATTFRATLIAYFAVLDALSLPLLWQAGLVSRDTLVAFALTLPLLILGTWAGARHFLRTDPQDFRRFAILLLAALAGMGLLKAVL